MEHAEDLVAKATETPTRAQMAGFETNVRAAPVRIAPEREAELRTDVFKGEPWPLEFDASLAPERNTFRAMPNARFIVINYAALASLFAVAKAAWLIAREGMAAHRAGRPTLDTSPGTPVFEARRLIDTAHSLVGDSGARWPADLAPPATDAAEGSEEWYANNVFLGATGWVVLHEIAHIALGHQSQVSSDVSYSQEHEADRWAAQWVLEALPAGHVQGPFRLFAISVALSWLALLDSVRRGSTTHPHAWQRMEKLSSTLSNDELNPGYEMAAYVLKVVFLADHETPPAPDPERAFFDLLFEANRLSR